MKQTGLITALALLAIMQSPIAIAETQQVIEFQIPAQNLSSALLQFSENSGVKTFFKADIARNINSKGLSGKYTPRQALDKLLENTGVNYRFTETESVTLSANRSEITTEMLLAQAPKSDYPADVITDEDYSGPVEQEDLTVSGRELIGYNVLNASTATKTDVPIFDTPVSIKVFPQQIIIDQQVIYLQDALKNDASADFGYSFRDPWNQTFTLRGFSTQPGTNGATVYREGINIQGAPTSTANLDRIELLKGPATILYGRAEPGGIVNLIPKKPLPEPYYALQQQLGSYDLYRTKLDATGPVNEDGSVRYRFNLEYLNSDSFRDFMSNETVSIAPTIAWDINDNTDLEIEFEYNNFEGNSNYGLPAIGNRVADVPINRSPGEPIDGTTSETFLVDVDFTHRFNAEWKVQWKGLFSRQLISIFDTYIFGDADAAGNFERFVYAEADSERDNWFTSFNVNGHFNTFGIEHNLLIGADYYKERYKQPFLDAQATGLNIFNPVYNTFSRADAFATGTIFDWRTFNEWYGVYFQDQITIMDKLHILGGFRYDNADGFEGDVTDGFNPSNNSDFTPRAGLVYQPWTWLSLYGYYTESFGIANGRSADGTQFKPTTAEQWEVGLKTEFMEGRLSATLAYYDLTRKNILTPDPVNPIFNRALGEANSKGVEFELTGQLTDQLAFIASYAYKEAKTTADNTIDAQGNFTRQGKFLPNVPRHAATLWGTYDITPQLKIGLGAYSASQRQGDFENTYQLPGYVRLDAMAAYRMEFGRTSLTAQVNINNFLDKEYVKASFGQREWTNIGEPLSVLGSLKLEY